MVFFLVKKEEEYSTFPTHSHPLWEENHTALTERNCRLKTTLENAGYHAACVGTGRWNVAGVSRVFSGLQTSAISAHLFYYPLTACVQYNTSS